MFSWKTQIRRNLIKFLFHLGIFGFISRLAFYYQATPKSEKGLFPFGIKRRENQSIQVLAYHRVTDENDCYFSPIRVEHFDKQMEFLREKFEVISAEESVERLSKNDVPPNCVVVTFDDGYRDNFSYAFPILKKYDIPATIYLATGCIQEMDVLWHDQICSAFKQTSETTLNLEDFNDETYDFTNPEERISALYRVLWSLREIPNEKRILWTKIIQERLGLKRAVRESSGERVMLNVEELRTLRDGGIALGAHTVSHPILSQTSLVHARQEICRSKSDIESQLQVQVKTFAYPSGRRGDFNEEVKELVKEEGFAGAFSMIYGANEFGGDLFELRRIPIGSWDVPYFSKELLLAKI